MLPDFQWDHVVLKDDQPNTANKLCAHQVPNRTCGYGGDIFGRTGITKWLMTLGFVGHSEDTQ